jgi:glycerate kinase
MEDNRQTRKVLIAPDSFKGSATNIEAALAIARGWKALRPDDEITLIPLADGGEGTLETITGIVPGSERIYLDVAFYKECTHRAYWSLLPDGTAIVELAIACGITHMPQLDPLFTHTYAFGQLIKSAALHPQVQKIITCLGGSASTDGGVGALMALGFRFYREDGSDIPLGGKYLNEIASFDGSESVGMPPGGIACLVDVTNVLIGDRGAAAIFGPQKGATRQEVIDLNSGLEKLLEISGGSDFLGAGAAGGTAFGLRTFLNTNIQSGSQSISELTGLESAVSSCDYVVTGEGLFDSQSVDGKVIGNLLAIAQKHEKKVLLCVGNTSIDFADVGLTGIRLIDIAESIDDAMTNATIWLEKAGTLLALKITD